MAQIIHILHFINYYASSTRRRALSNVCRVHREYSWRPQLLEARRAGRRRPGVYGLELDRSVRRVQRRGHIVAASRLQLVMVDSLLNYVPDVVNWTDVMVA